MIHYYDTFPTPLGDFSAALDENGAVVATAFGGLETLRTRFRCGSVVRNTGRVAAVLSQIQQFFAGQRRHFELRLAPSGTTFQQRVWTELRRIPFGQTRSYAQLAAALGCPGAARAVGRANATNPICLLIPCHRVIGGNGTLTGFAFGVEVKRRLLAHEHAGPKGTSEELPGDETRAGSSPARVGARVSPL